MTIYMILFFKNKGIHAVEVNLLSSEIGANGWEFPALQFCVGGIGLYDWPVARYMA
jgi:hypothetical protein